jgi:hypothetical protein
LTSKSRDEKQLSKEKSKEKENENDCEKREINGPEEELTYA